LSDKKAYIKNVIKEIIEISSWKLARVIANE
jgi:hypothetical protein